MGRMRCSAAVARAPRGAGPCSAPPVPRPAGGGRRPDLRPGPAVGPGADQRAGGVGHGHGRGHHHRGRRLGRGPPTRTSPKVAGMSCVGGRRPGRVRRVRPGRPRPRHPLGRHRPGLDRQRPRDGRRGADADLMAVRVLTNQCAVARAARPGRPTMWRRGSAGPRTTARHDQPQPRRRHAGGARCRVLRRRRVPRRRAPSRSSPLATTRSSRPGSPTSTP